MTVERITVTVVFTIMTSCNIPTVHIGVVTVDEADVTMDGRVKEARPTIAP